MSQQKKSKISCFNDPSEKSCEITWGSLIRGCRIVNRWQNIKEIKSKVASVLEACANQQQVSREVYTEQNKETGKKISEYFLFWLEEYSNAQFAKKNCD